MADIARADAPVASPEDTRTRGLVPEPEVSDLVTIVLVYFRLARIKREVEARLRDYLDDGIYRL
ncbi:hypothetical protein [Methylopila sp. 73B]|uniref:hypothetical protein n=1 Tax=Methylopila sp. 73B TaxID=1120792 RepID=UPI000379B903|nr:hypothetical protein [Methylopila sp. 73B]